MLHDLKIKLDLPDEANVDEVEDQKLAEAMDVELHSFEQWFRGKGNDPLVGVERAILKTYLAWKLRYEAAEGSKQHYMFRGIYKGKQVEFEDLCTGCESILDNHWEDMARQLQKASPIRKKSKKSQG
jgi:hypothetical protein